jgi:hypothetical protein
MQAVRCAAIDLPATVQTVMQLAQHAMLNSSETRDNYIIYTISDY